MMCQKYPGIILEIFRFKLSASLIEVKKEAEKT